MVYVADSQSDTTDNPGFTQGIRIGSAKDGKVTAFIPMSSAELGAPEGVGVDDMGNVYGGWVTKMNMRRFVTVTRIPFAPPMTLGNMRGQGVRGLAVHPQHSAAITLCSALTNTPTKSRSGPSGCG